MSLRERIRKLEARGARERDLPQVRAAHRAFALERLERLGVKGDFRPSPVLTLLRGISAMTDYHAAHAALAEYEANAAARARARLRKLGAPLRPDRAPTTRRRA